MLAKVQSPLQELEVVPHGRPLLLVYKLGGFQVILCVCEKI